MRVAYLSAGTIGAGHAVRGLAVQRALIRFGAAVECQLFFPDTGFAGLPRDDVQHVNIVGDAALLSTRSVLSSPLAAALSAFAADLVIVDLFWLPFQALLRALNLPAWLLIRSCPTWWFDGPSGHRLDPKVYSRIFAIEPGIAPWIGERIDPLVIVNPEECHPQADLREHFLLEEDQPLHVIVHAGVAQELDDFHRLHAPDNARILDLRQEASLFPAAAWLGGADSIVSAAGYNSFYEAKWLGYFARCRFLPMIRSIDDQAGRMQNNADFVMRANGADALVQAILRGG